MWKKIVAMSLVLVLFLSFTACAKAPSVQEIIDGVIESQDDIKSYKFDLNMNLEVASEEGGEVFEWALAMDSSSAMDIENKEFSTDIIISREMTGEDELTVVYGMYLVDNMGYMMAEYPEMEPMWMKAEVPEEAWEEAWEETSEMLPPIEPHLSLLELAEVTVIGSEKVKGVDCYVLELTPDLEQLWEMVIQQLEAGYERLPYVDEEVLREAFSSFSVKQWVTKATYFLTKSEIDISMEMTPELMDFMGLEGTATMGINITFLLYDHNQPITIVLPPEALEATASYVSEEPTPTGTELYIDLWEQAIAYRDQHATTYFELDLGTEVVSGELNITAYNADPTYLRSISFYLGGDGGDIGTYHVGPGQVRGEGTIGPLQTKSWVFDLSQAMIADSNSPEGYRYVDFVGIINNLTRLSNPIKVEAWVSTFTSTAWISASLELELEEEQANGTPEVEEVTPTGTETVIFPDENLAASIRTALGKGPEDKITVAELGELTELDVSKQGIANITGIEYCVNLTEFSANENQISDISSLANLTSLIMLELQTNQISDISALANLTSLTELNLSGNEISDISPLSSLTNLTKLALSMNEISDISTLASLNSLTKLALDANQISDISPLVNLTSLTTLLLWGVPRSDEALNVIIPQLKERGVEVWW